MLSNTKSKSLFLSRNVKERPLEFCHLLFCGQVPARKPDLYRFSSKDSILLIYTISGKGQIETEDQAFEAEPGSLFLSQGKSEYTLAAITPAWNFNAITFEGKWPMALLAEKGGKIFKLSPASQSPALVDCICSLGHGRNEFSPSDREDLFFAKWITDILVEFSLLGVSTETDKKRVTKAIKTIKTMLETNYAKNLTLDMLEDEFGVNKYRICREFKKEYGTSPIQFINQRRIDRAKELLFTTDQTVTQIGLAVGFENINHFINTFKKFTGTTPLNYKKNTAPILQELYYPSQSTGLPR
ncbi:MAG: AraC family transcriptional regulator [Pseudobutyrivibrio sp.]|nr:AraC family transcriptional regulator [Pseudobutyrivibrio sp.]